MKRDEIPNDISVRPLVEADVSTADHIVRLAFGTFLGLPDPTAFMGDANYVRTRWVADPSAAFGAELGGEIVGSNFAANWGSFGFFGPLTIRPDLWDRGIGKHLMEPIMDCFANWGVKHAGLFTFSQSQKHVGLYQKFGFWPRYLTAVMSKTVTPSPAISWSKYSEMSEGAKESAIGACREVTHAIYDGLDVSREVRAVSTQGLGEIVLLWDDSELAGFAVCHCGPGSEAGSSVCYVKFGAVRPGRSEEALFGRLLAACEQMAAQRNLTRIVAGVNTSRYEAYRQMLSRGFRTDVQGIAMQRPNESAYNRPGVYVIDDWR